MGLDTFTAVLPRVRMKHIRMLHLFHLGVLSLPISYLATSLVADFIYYAIMQKLSSFYSLEVGNSRKSAAHTIPGSLR